SNVAKTVCSVTAGGTPPQGITWPVTPSVCVPTLETFKSVTVSSTTGSTPLPTQPENDCAIPRKPLSDKPVVAACGTICVNSYCGASAKSTSRFRLVMAGIEPPGLNTRYIVTEFPGAAAKLQPVPAVSV